jgi:hypothetical protein
LRSSSCPHLRNDTNEGEFVIVSVIHHNRTMETND